MFPQIGKQGRIPASATVANWISRRMRRIGTKFPKNMHESAHLRPHHHERQASTLTENRTENEGKWNQTKAGKSIGTWHDWTNTSQTVECTLLYIYNTDKQFNVPKNAIYRQDGRMVDESTVGHIDRTKKQTSKGNRKTSRKKEFKIA